MPAHKWETVKKGRLSAQKVKAAEDRADADVVEMELSAVRKLAGKTQVDLAKAAKFTQGELSRAERRDDHLLSTLRRYVGGLGGEIEVIAKIGRKRIRLRGV